MTPTTKIKKLVAETRKSAVSFPNCFPGKVRSSSIRATRMRSRLSITCGQRSVVTIHLPIQPSMRWPDFMRHSIQLLQISIRFMFYFASQNETNGANTRPCRRAPLAGVLERWDRREVAHHAPIRQVRRGLSPLRTGSTGAFSASPSHQTAPPNIDPILDSVRLRPIESLRAYLSANVRDRRNESLHG